MSYIDPGSGSLAYQILLSTILALTITARRALRRIAGRFRKTSVVDVHARQSRERR